jgi:PIN domain nuclease of toxin-antitoxin system
MICLLDTHALIWYLSKTEELSERVKRLIADPHADIYASTISFWEMSIKHSYGKLSFDDVFEVDDLEEILDEHHIGVIGLNERESSSYHRLPKVEGHKDPFDRLLIWQAMTRNMALISADKSFDPYRAFGLRIVW